jgi:hypothetical protein
MCLNFSSVQVSEQFILPYWQLCHWMVPVHHCTCALRVPGQIATVSSHLSDRGNSNKLDVVGRISPCLRACLLRCFVVTSTVTNAAEEMKTVLWCTTNSRKQNITTSQFLRLSASLYGVYFLLLLLLLLFSYRQIWFEFVTNFLTALLSVPFTKCGSENELYPRTTLFVNVAKRHVSGKT